MMKNTFKKVLLFSVVIGVAFPVATSAHDGMEHSDGHTKEVVTQSEKSSSADSIRKKVEDQKKAIEDNVQSAKSEVKQKLDDAKRKVCDTNQSRINSIMGNMDNRRQSAYDRITTAYTAVKKFQSSKQLSIANYDALVAAVDSAQSAALTAMKAQQTMPEFTCSGDHPRADLSNFKLKRSDSITAMQTYRQAVKDLISAVKTAANAEKVSQS